MIVDLAPMTTLVDCSLAPQILYGCMLRHNMQMCRQFSSILPDRYGSYTGLRQTAEEAFERQQKIQKRQLQPTDIILFSVTFTCLGWMHVTTTMRGSVPVLQRKTYSGGIDYGVWHYNDSLPLICKTTSGDLLFEVVFHCAS